MSTAAGTLRVLVVDDEQPARDELVFQLGRLDAVGEVRQAGDAATALQVIEQEELDALFLDVRMPHIDGLDLARVVRRRQRRPLIVFVTAFDDYAVEAFGLAAVDYLLKPVRQKRLRATVQRLLDMRRRGSEHDATGAAAREGPTAPRDSPADQLDDRLAVISRGRIVLLPIEEIRLVVVSGERVTVRTAGETAYQVHHSLAELEKRLRHHGFIRVHRSYLVNLRHVLTIEGFFNGTYVLKLRDVPDVTVPVSRRHAAELRSAVRF